MHASSRDQPATRTPARRRSVGLAGLEADLLKALVAREVRGVLVEGGAEVAGSFLEAGLVDRVAMFVAPLLLGGAKAPTAVAGLGRELKRALALDAVEVRRIGADVLIEGDVRRS